MTTCYDEQGRAWTFDGVEFSSTDTIETYTEAEFAIHVPVAHAEYLAMARMVRLAFGRGPRNSQHYSEHIDEGMVAVPPNRSDSSSN